MAAAASTSTLRGPLVMGQAEVVSGTRYAPPSAGAIIHEEQELQAHHSNVFVRILGSMQLTVIGLHGWVSQFTFCFFFPLNVGAYVLCAILIVRGVLAVLEFFGFVTLIFYRYNWHNPFLFLAHLMLLAGGVGDLVAACYGVFGAALRSILIAAVLPMWMIIHIFFGFFFSLIVITEDVLDAGTRVIPVLLSLLTLAFDCFVLATALQVLLKATWKGTVAPSMMSTIQAAETIALSWGSYTIDKNHIVAALLQDEVSRNILTTGGVDVARLHSVLHGGHFLAGPRWGLTSIEDSFHLRLGHDASCLIARASREQWKAGHGRLTADHLLLALCEFGEIVIEPRVGGFERVVPVPGPDGHSHMFVQSDQGLQVFPAPQVAAMRVSIEEDLFMHEAADPAPPAPAFCCVPLEETVAVYAAGQLILCCVSVYCVVVHWRGIGALFGLRTIEVMRMAELWVSIVGIIVCALALYGIITSRVTRRQIRREGHRSGVRWDADLADMFRVVCSTCRPEVVEIWLKDLMRGARFMAFYFFFCMVQVFFEGPSFAMFLVVGDVCDAYRHGVMAFSYNDYVPMRCTALDSCVIGAVVGWFLFKLYMCWCILALWHQYSFGWTITDLKGVAYLDPVPELPPVCLYLLAGLPLGAQRRLGNKNGETKPLML